ncbi:unnamed protein product [Oikopleura dioica]|uniref:Uncharacterized protein n=1 Tax=Oikopleura dioica TaxID=34765 RepID=E4YBR7_OIKDI|nr:unnamed protein product [Oikopleura dioica]
MVIDLNAVEPTDVNITYTTASCQILNGDDENWDYDSCQIDPFKTTTEVTSCDCGETSADIKVSTRVFTPPSTIDFSSVFENVCMDCAMPIIQFVILMFGVWAAMCIWSRRNDLKDLTQLKLIDLRSYHNRYNLVQQDYLIVVRTSTHTTIGMKNPQTGYISFHIKSTYAASDLERFLHGAFIHRSYSLLLPDNVHFTPGSEQAFLIRSNAPLEQAHRVQLWANFEGMDISWRPESVKVYIPRSEATTGIPAFGSIKKQFEKVNQFKISGKIGLSEETEILTAPSKKLLKQLNMAPKVNMSANPITILKKNFHIENIKLAIFSYSPWEFCNRSAKTMIVHATLAVASVANMMFYQTPKTTPIEIGPIQLDPQSYLVNMYVTLLTVTTTLVFAYVFQNTLPSSLQGASGADNFNVGRSRWMRPLAYILCTFVILVSYFFTILYGLQLTKVPVKNWVGSQVIGIITDFLAGPVLIVLIKGYLSYFFGYKRKRQAKYFIHDPSGLKHDSFEVSIAKITQKPSEINDARATKAARIDKKFKKSLHQTFRSIISTLVTTAVYFILSRSFIADEKFEVDKNLRSRFRSDFTENIATVGEIWSVIDDFKAVNFANTSYDGKLLSAFERRKASDHISLRVGPARLLQTRKQGGNYAPKWVPRSIEDMKDYEKESPYLVPWISSASEVPEDFIEQIFNSVTNHRYEAELGVDLDSCELIIEELKNSAWIDNSTSFLMIEQTYFNGNINIFAQLRLTFERTPGGGYTPTLSINQFVYTHGSQSNLYFAAYCIFAIQFITKLISMLRRIYNRKLDKKLLANAIFVIMDTLMTYFFISRLLVTTEAVRIYSINPRQRPPFDQVFILQTYCSSTIALALFFNSFHVIFVLTGLNMVKIYFDVIRKIVRKSLGLACFMIPITVAFALVGMVFLNSYSARFKSFGDSVISLMVFGYLKPNDLKPIMEKGEAVSFLRIYHIGYLVVAIFAIVNFIVAVISDADSKARKCLRPADQLQYVLTMMKLKSEELTAESRKQKKYDDFISAARAAMIYNKPLSSDRRLTDILS